MHNEIITINYWKIACKNIYRCYYEEFDGSSTRWYFHRVLL